MNNINEEILNISLEKDVSVNAVIGYRDDTSRDKLFFVFPPHPVLGGDIENNVVESIFNGFASEGYISVKFSYRGVESQSIEGEHFIPYWEKLEKEKDYSLIVNDVRKIVDFVKSNVSSEAEIYFVPYSFGNLIALSLLKYFDVKDFLGISPPIDEYDFDNLFSSENNLNFIITHEDIFCEKLRMQDLCMKSESDLRIFNSDDHFYRGSENELFNLIKEKILYG